MTQKDARRRALQRQIERLDGRLATLNQTSERLTRWRLFLFLGAVGASLLILWQWGALAWVGGTAVALLPFIWSVRAHRLVENGRSCYAVWRQIKQTHLARMDLDWQNIPPAPPVPPRLDHPFALDLDLIGDHSLLQLLDTAVSHDGGQRLQQWLLDTDPQLATIQSRQPLVEELAAMPRFRDKLALHATLAADDTAEKWPIQRLLDWLKAGDAGTSLRPTLWLLSGLALLNLALLGLNLVGLLPSLWPVSWLLYGLLFVSRMQAVAPLFSDAYFLETSLRRLGEVFGFLEGYRYGERERVRQLCAPFLDPAERPSRHLRAATLVLTMAGLRQNPFLWLLLNGFVPWDFFAAYQLERRRAALSQRLPGWLDGWFELEALNSLATFAYLNPDAPFPMLTTQTDAPPLWGTAVGHPLIPDATRVCNDFRIDNLGELAIITGSNMAGKSSFLRALGVNLVLANCGGPVLADAFQARLCRLYTSIRVADSVTDGFSYFYAEVRRLQGLLAALGEGDERPLCFLIDEIFRGTNNRERLIGSRSFARALVGGHGIGLIATHDLELVKLADESAAIRNYHFRDDVADGQMTFDYTLRPGPCPTTNALKIMRLAGLPVERD